MIPMKRVEPAPKDIIIMINNKCFDAIQDQVKSIILISILALEINRTKQLFEVGIEYFFL